MKTKEEQVLYNRLYWPRAVALRDIGRYLDENKIHCLGTDHWNVTRRYLDTPETIKLNNDLGLFTINR